MSLDYCADLVARGDPRRFRAAMAAPVRARTVLFPLYAFNIEVTRSPWLASEPMIAEMRLQWWRDALEEIAEGRGRRHQVIDALGFLDKESVQALDRMIAVRRWDIYRDPFEDEDHFRNYVAVTGTTLIEAARRSLGLIEDPKVRGLGYGAGLARFFLAIPALEARGRVPLVDGRAEAVQKLASEALRDMPTCLRDRGIARGPLLEAVGARQILKRAVQNPSAVAAGRLDLAPIAERWGLIRAALAGRF